LHYPLCSLRFLAVSRPAVVPLPAAEAAPAPIAAVDETTPTAPTPTAPHVIPEAPPEEHAVDTTAVDHNKDGYLDSAEFNDIRGLVLAKAENAALRYMQSVDTDKNKMLSLEEAQAYILKEHGIGSRDVERVWKLVVPDTTAEMDALQFSKLRRRIRGMTIRLARQIMKIADTNGDGHISLDEAQAIAFEQEGIGAGDVAQMFASVDDNNDGELNAPEFADFERIVRARAVETSKKALRTTKKRLLQVVDTDGSNTLTMDEAKRIAFEHYGFDENILTPFFDQADENEDGHLDAVEFAGFRSVIRSKAVRNAVEVLKEIDLDGDGLVSMPEAEEKTKREDDMESHETATLFNIADQNKSGKLDKVELADFIRLVRLSAIRFATDHFKVIYLSINKIDIYQIKPSMQEFDANRDRLVTVDELAQLIETKYHVPFDVTKEFFSKVDVDGSGDLIPAEIVDFRHEIRKYVAQHPMPFPSEREDVSSSNQHSPTQTNRIPRRFY
ncbi:EF hand, partial [Ancylostoma ceylanicum]